MTRTDRLKGFLLVSLLFSLFIPVQAQTDSLLFEEVRSLTHFYEYLLNTVGASKTPVRDKEVIINESYRKVFMNARVQIEDDLLPDRKVITNKNVDAYLRDVDFFFQNISFHFENIKISQNQLADSGEYFLAQFESLLTGTTLEGESFERRSPRYLEINADPESKDLKIVSVYSTKITREKEIAIWWENLSNEWKSILIEYVPFDSISEDLPMRLAKLDSINLQGRFELLDIRPLQALNNLRYVNLSNTQVVDLKPLRYASKLEVLDLANTPIFDLKPLQYFRNLKQLNIQNTLVTDLQPLSDLKKIKGLNVAAIAAENLTPLIGLTLLDSLDASQTSFSSLSLLTAQNLQWLNLDGTNLANLSHADKLPKLNYLSLNQSKILSLEGIEKHPSLREISINGTIVTDLSPMSSLPKLERVRADNTPITEKMAGQFMRGNPRVAVITNSSDLANWWQSISSAWKSELRKYVGENPDESRLARLFQMDSLILNDPALTDALPLRKFKNLIYLNINETALNPEKELKTLTELEHLEAKSTNLSGFSFADATPKLRLLELQGSNVSSIKDLEHLKAVERIHLGKTPLALEQPAAIEAVISNGFPGVVIYRTEALFSWRDSLNSPWKKALRVEGIGETELHELTQRSELVIRQSAISDLEGLTPFFNLQSLKVNEVALRDLGGIEKFVGLKELTVTNSPLQNISALRDLELQKVDLTNTAIEELEAFSNMQSLTHLNCSGTQIRRLKPLESLTEVVELDVSNTQVFRLDKLEQMRKLRKLVCYNTKLRQHEVEDFKNVVPNCEVLFY